MLQAIYSLCYPFNNIEHGAEANKISDGTSSSNGETLERGNQKNEKTHQKVTLPTFDKRGIHEAKLWWRRFTQYIKMTQNIELKTITTDREFLEQYRADLDNRIKDLFIWALGESAITKMTRTVRDNDPNRADINSYTHCSVYNDTAEDVWTRILQVEKTVNSKT